MREFGKNLAITREDVSNSVAGFDRLNPEQQELAIHLAENATEAAMQMELAGRGGPDSGLYIGGAKTIFAGKVVGRALLAQKMGLTDDQIISAIEKGLGHLPDRE